jgi:starvation-inducible DNA-binding protein
MPSRTLIEGVPTDEQIEEFLDAMGLVEEAAPEPEEPVEPVEPEEPEESGGGEDSDPTEGDDESEADDDGSVAEVLRIALANTFAMYLRAHVFHWNVVGPNFVADHKYLDELVGELYGAIDPLAEHIRVLGELTPSGIGEFAGLSEIDDPGTPEATAPAIWEELLAANDIVLGSLMAAFAEAEIDGDQGLMDFLAGRIDAHGKHRWFLRSLLGQTA